MEGDAANVALSSAAVIPLAGTFVTGGKYVTRSSDVLGHIFRNTAGHVNPATIASQNKYIKLFESVANNADNLNPNILSEYQRAAGGFEAYSKTYRNGKQVWAQAEGGKIFNAGVNNIPKIK